MFADFLNYISDSQIITFGSFIFGILSLIFAYIFYKKGRRFKKILYLKKSFNIVENFTQHIDERLSLKYDNEEIQNLTITNILLCNTGNETINFSDIAKADPIKIFSLNKANILKLSIIYPDSCANNFKLLRTRNKDSYTLHFDYIDKREKVVIKALHSGKSSDDIVLKGHIKGIGKIIEADLEKHIDPLLAFSKSLVYVFILLTTPFLLISFFRGSSLDIFSAIGPYYKLFNNIFYFIVFGIFAYIFYQIFITFNRLKDNSYFLPNIFLNPNITGNEIEREINKK